MLWVILQSFFGVLIGSCRISSQIILIMSLCLELLSLAVFLSSPSDTSPAWLPVHGSLVGVKSDGIVLTKCA